MCETYILNAKARDLANPFQIEVSDQLEFDFRIRGYKKTELAPIVVNQNEKLQLREKMFSLCPSWEKEFPAPFAAYNARMSRFKRDRNKNLILDHTGEKIIERIYEIPAWKESFNLGQTCLVPLNAAVESSYFGTHGGQMVQFKIKGDGVFFVAGLWNDWIDKKTGESKETFTLITDDPCEAFHTAGHDRSIFVIAETAYEEWLVNKKMSGIERYEFLQANRITLPWKVETDRMLKSNWQKNAPTQAEIDAIKIWKPS